uniref:Uncharacterized protein n=1 Tax=Fagus sylvatica TaxID=28930 RepID=A0A2N9IX40_FAGSY
MDHSRRRGEGKGEGGEGAVEGRESGRQFERRGGGVVVAVAAVDLVVVLTVVVFAVASVMGKMMANFFLEGCLNATAGLAVEVRSSQKRRVWQWELGNSE